METKYRLLEQLEECLDGDEVLTVGMVWQRVCECVAGQDLTRPMRRPDDGKGKYIICGDPEGEEFWKWGVGWVTWTPETRDWNHENIWRKAREVENPTPALWVVVHTAGSCNDYTSVEDQTFSSWQEACEAAKQQARINGAGAEFAVAHIYLTFRCSVEVVEKEVGK